MYNFIKNIFGVPSNAQSDTRLVDEVPPNKMIDNLPPDMMIDNVNNDRRRNDDFNDHVDEDDFGGGFESNMRTFGFPIFSDPIEIHKYFESLVDEMQRKFNMFAFGNNSAFWKNDKDNYAPPSHFDRNDKKPKCLRDAYLKSPGYISDMNLKKEDIDLDGQVQADDVENFLSKPGSSSTTENSTIIQSSSPGGCYSKSVYIRTIRRPDGSVETIKKIKDHTGKEETIVTHEENSPAPTNDDVSGVSIFRKFFPF